MANSLHERIKKHVLPDVSETAKTAVRLDFNPSADKTVDRIKMLAAALITECEVIRTGARGPVQGRWASLGITAAEETAMWAVKAATSTKADEPPVSTPAPTPPVEEPASD